MPDPRSLEVGDRVRFVSLPEEWSAPDYFVHEETVEFMRLLVARGRSSRIARIDSTGFPWFDARERREDGSLAYHGWMITEETGWVRVHPRR